MSDTVVHIGENSPQHVAFRLMEHIASIERKALHHVSNMDPDWTVASRQWILDTYRECLHAVQVNKIPEHVSKRNA